MIPSILLPRQKHTRAPALAEYHKVPLQDPGAAQYVYNKTLLNPLLLQAGPGIHCGAKTALQPTPFVYNLSVVSTGLPGIQAGTFGFTPLSDGSNLYGD